MRIRNVSDRKSVVGFTLVELLVVISIIAILASMLMPTLAKAKAKAQRTVCLNQAKELELCWLMYSHDNDRLPLSYFFEATGGANTNAWILGSMDDNPAFGKVDPGVLDSTNSHSIQLGKLFPYNTSTKIYRCPSDKSQTQGTPRVRSYSINGWMGGRPLAGQNQYRVYARESDIVDPSPSKAFVFIDEHEKSINDGWFIVDMIGKYGLLDAPGSRHDNGYTLSFADGHVEGWKLRDNRTIAWGNLPIPNSPLNSDWNRLRVASSSLQ